MIRYQTPAAEREKRFESLAAKAHQVSESFPEPQRAAGVGRHRRQFAGPARRAASARWAWSSRPRRCTSSAIQIDGKALDGSAYNSLGVLYYKVPGWPLGFGDKDKAKELLQKALAINPQGIDPNYFYGEYLVETKQADEAVPYLERALQAPPRPGRQIADTGRREEVRALLAKLKAN